MIKKIILMFLFLLLSNSCYSLAVIKKDITNLVAWEALPYALLSEAIYENRTIEGWSIVEDRNEEDLDSCIKIKPGYLHTLSAYDENNLKVSKSVCTGLNKNGFHGVAYKNENEKIVAIVFKGTDMGSALDWMTNFQQVLASKNPFSITPLTFWVLPRNGDVKVVTNIGKGYQIPKQYQVGMEFSQHVIKKYKDYKIVLAGHSLGGGIAKYVSLRTNKTAYTFNGAGLSFATGMDALLKNDTESSKSKIINIVGYYNNLPDPVSEFSHTPDRMQYNIDVDEYHKISPLIASLKGKLPAYYGKGTYLIDACATTLNSIDLSKVNPDYTSSDRLVGDYEGIPYSAFYDNYDDAYCQKTINSQFIDRLCFKKDGSSGLKYRWKSTTTWYKSPAVHEACVNWFSYKWNKK